MANIYQQLGYLALGSRLRRISETFLAEINLAYQLEGIQFEASWFPVFYLLAKHKKLSIKELSEQTEVSHPAASQLVANLKSKGFLKSVTSNDDGRKQLVMLTKSGEHMLAKIESVWAVISQIMDDLAFSNPGCETLLTAITAFEQTFQNHNLAKKIS
ncbi:MAG: MarR family transcriptional regulator [Mucilaginibacter sp.]|nr:MarR family transcriptional regulator [Mucilaginibacter sp.]